MITTHRIHHAHQRSRGILRAVGAVVLFSVAGVSALAVPAVGVPADAVDPTLRRAMTMDGLLGDWVWTSIDWFDRPAELAAVPVARGRKHRAVAGRPAADLAGEAGEYDAVDLFDQLLVRVHRSVVPAIYLTMWTLGQDCPEIPFLRQIDPFSIPGDGGLWMKLPVTSMDEGIVLGSWLSVQPGIRAVEPNRLLRVSGVTPNDPQFPSQWCAAAIDAPNAWANQTGETEEVVVAVIDTGVDWRQPDIAPNVWVNPGEDLDADGQLTSADLNGIDDDGNGRADDIVGWDFIEFTEADPPLWPSPEDEYEDQDSNPMDVAGHGTCIASVALARGNDGAGMAGISWGARVMCLRAGYASSYCGYIDQAAAAEAIVYAVENGARIAVTAWESETPSQLEEDVLEWASCSGLLVCAPAGNHARDEFQPDAPSYPAAHPRVLAVAGLDETRIRATWPIEWYYWEWSKCGPWVDLAAPAVDVLVGLPVSPDECIVEDNFITEEITTLPVTPSTWYSHDAVEGTSFAAAHVAGAAALVAAQYPDAGPEEIAYRLLSTADSVDAENPLLAGMFGAGQVNVAAAVAGEADLPGFPALRSFEGPDAGCPAPRLVFTVASGWTYEVQVAGDPAGPWTVIGEPITADPGQFEVDWIDDGADGAAVWTPAAAVDQRIYRLHRINDEPGTVPAT